MDRFNIGTGIALAVAVLALGGLAFYGPPEHRTVALTALVGLSTTLAAALQGRLRKRAPASFKGGSK